MASVDWTADAKYFGRTTSSKLRQAIEPPNIYTSDCEVVLNPYPFAKYWCGTTSWSPEGCGASTYYDAGFLSPRWKCVLAAGTRTYAEPVSDLRLVPLGSVFTSLNASDIPFELALDSPGVPGEPSALNWILTAPFDLCETYYRYTETDTATGLQTFSSERTYQVKVEHISLSIFNAVRNLIGNPVETGMGGCGTGSRIIFSQTLTGSTVSGTPVTAGSGFDLQCYGQDLSVLEAWDDNTIGPPYRRLLHASNHATWPTDYQACDYDPATGDLKWPHFMYGEPKWGVGLNVDYHLTYNGAAPVPAFPGPDRCTTLNKTNRYHSTEDGYNMYPDWPEANVNGRGKYYTDPALTTRVVPTVFIDFISTV